MSVQKTCMKITVNENLLEEAGNSKKSLLSDDEESYEVKTRKLVDNSTDESLDLCKKPIIRVSEQALLDLCIGIMKTDIKVVFAKSKSIKFIEDVENVLNVLRLLCGFKHNEFQGITAHKHKETYSFLIFEDVLLRYLQCPYETDAFVVRTWKTNEIVKKQSQTALICSTVIPIKNSINNIRRSANKLLESLLNDDVYVKEYEFILTPGCVEKPVHVKGITVIPNPEIKKNAGQKVTIKIIDKKFKYKLTRTNEPSMPNEDNLRKKKIVELLNLLINEGNNLKPVDTPPEIPKIKRLSGLALETLLKKCGGLETKTKRIVLLEFCTKSRLDTTVKQRMPSLV